jgi:hypothetical protein
MTTKTADERRAIYTQVGDALAEHGWVNARSYLDDYSRYSRGMEFIHVRFGHEVLRPTWAEYMRPRLVGERDDFPADWTGRLPYWVTRPLPRAGLLDALMAVITAEPVDGPWAKDEDDAE